MSNVLRCFLLIAVITGTPYAERGSDPYSHDRAWGSFGAAPGQFKYPTMIAVDNRSNVYVVDQHNHRIQKFDTLGNHLLSWGQFGDGQGEFNYPFGIAVDSADAVYVTDMDNHRIQKFSPNGKFLGQTGSHGAGNGQFKHPYGIAIDRNDIVYVVDSLNYRIQKFDQGLSLIGAWGSEKSIGVQLYMVHEIAMNVNGNILLSDRQNHRISEFTTDGKLVRRFGRFGEMRAPAEDLSDTGYLSEPHGVAAAPDGLIIICDRYNYRLQVFGQNGQYHSALYPRGPRSDTGQYVLGVAIDKQGNIYLTDHYQHCVQKYRRFRPWAATATEFGAPGRTRK